MRPGGITLDYAGRSFCYQFDVNPPSRATQSFGSVFRGMVVPCLRAPRGALQDDRSCR